MTMVSAVAANISFAANVLLEFLLTCDAVAVLAIFFVFTIFFLSVFD